MAAKVWFYAHSEELYIPADKPQDNHMAIYNGGIKGWWGTPDLKVEMTKRQTGDGDFPISDAAVLYASRIVTLDILVKAPTRQEYRAALEKLNRLTHAEVTLRVADAQSDTYATGHVRFAADDEQLATNRCHVTLTVTCADPRRYSWATHSGVMVPTASSNGGLIFDATGVLKTSPVSFSGSSTTQNICTLTNSGTSEAYPIIRASGNLPEGFTITDVGTGRQLSYSQPVAWAPVVLDCLSRTANINGVDVTRSLTHREWPTIPAGGSITLALSASGEGHVSAECRDTYV